MTQKVLSLLFLEDMKSIEMITDKLEVISMQGSQNDPDTKMCSDNLLSGFLKAQYWRILSTSEESWDNWFRRFCSSSDSLGSLHSSPHDTNTNWSRFNVCRVKCSVPNSSNRRRAEKGRFRSEVQESRN